MKILYLDTKLELKEIPEPECIFKNDVLIKVVIAGICRTDIELVKGYMGFKGVPGHEFVGVVEKAGNSALIGKRVVGEINSGCGKCEECEKGMERHCASRDVLGILGRNGAFEEKLVLPEKNIFVLPDTLADEAAVFVEPVAACYEIIEQSGGMPPKGRVLVVGDGKLGTLAAMVLKAEGCDVVLAGKYQKKMGLISSLSGICAYNAQQVESMIFDVVVECSGKQSGLELATKVCRPRGTIFLKSTYDGSATLDMALWVINEITIIGSRCGRFQPAIDALSSGKVNPIPFIEKTYPFERVVDGFEHAQNAEFGKILIKF